MFKNQGTFNGMTEFTLNTPDTGYTILFYFLEVRSRIILNAHRMLVSFRRLFQSGDGAKWVQTA